MNAAPLPDAATLIGAELDRLTSARTTAPAGPTGALVARCYELAGGPGAAVQTFWPGANNDWAPGDKVTNLARAAALYSLALDEAHARERPDTLGPVPLLEQPGYLAHRLEEVTTTLRHHLVELDRELAGIDSLLAAQAQVRAYEPAARTVAL